MIPILGLLIGILIGVMMPITISAQFSTYVAVAILAALDSVFGGIRAELQKKFDLLIFLSGFFSNALMAAGLAFIGDKLGIPVYLAAVFAFGNRLINNLAEIRRILLTKMMNSKFDADYKKDDDIE